MVLERAAGQKQVGLALLSVLWVVLILSVMALTQLNSAIIQNRLTYNLRQQVELENIADAGIYIAIQRLAQPHTASTSISPLKGFATEFAYHQIEISMEDEQGKLDINQVDPGLVEKLLLYLKIDPDQAQFIADNYRTHYLEGGRNTSEKIFLSAAEFAQFVEKNISQTNLFYDCLKSYITVYSGLSNINRNSASAAVLKFLSWADGNAENEPINQNPTVQSVLRTDTSYAGRAFSIQAKVSSLKSEVAVTRRAVIRLTGDRQNPFWIHEWQTDSPGETHCSLGSAHPEAH